MPRKAAPKPIGDHVATLARVQQAIAAAPKMAPARVKKINTALGVAMAELQAEMVK